MTRRPPREGEGRPRLDPDHETTVLRVRVPASLIERLDAAADRRGLDRSKCVRRACEIWLREQERRRTKAQKD